MPQPSPAIPPPPLGRRRHPALRARKVAGATSAVAMVGLTGYLAAAGGLSNAPVAVEEALPAQATATTATTSPATTATTSPATTAPTTRGTTATSAAPATTATTPTTAQVTVPATTATTAPAVASVPSRSRSTTSRGS